jgi:hypothetical protein
MIGLRHFFLFSIILPQSVCVYTVEEVHGFSEFLRAGDNRLIRQRAHPTSSTRSGYFCKILDRLILTLRDSKEEKAKLYAADAITTCLLHQPTNQNLVGMNPIFHETVVEYLREEPHAAAEIIWAATESNTINLSGFIEKDAIEDLFRVMQYYENSVSAMWAAAALTNMATSYCGQGHPCNWKWNKKRNILKTTHAIEVDGLVARLQLSQIDGIWELLEDQVCSSVAFEGVEELIAPSQAGYGNDHASLVPWAMAGLIQVLALHPVTRSRRLLEKTLPCLCFLSSSDDPLERRMAWEAIYHMGHEGACHIEDVTVGVCIDMPFISSEGLRCSDIRTTVDCVAYHKEKDSNISAKDACCVCGGGTFMSNPFVKVTHDDL